MKFNLKRQALVNKFSNILEKADNTCQSDMQAEKLAEEYETDNIKNKGNARILANYYKGKEQSDVWKRKYAISLAEEAARKIDAFLSGKDNIEYISCNDTVEESKGFPLVSHFSVKAANQTNDEAKYTTMITVLDNYEVKSSIFRENDNELSDYLKKTNINEYLAI